MQSSSPKSKQTPSKNLSSSYITEQEKATPLTDEMRLTVYEDEEIDDSDADPPYRPSSSSAEEPIDFYKSHDVKTKREGSKRSNPTTWVKTVRKLKRNSGMSYTTTSKKNQTRTNIKKSRD